MGHKKDQVDVKNKNEKKVLKIVLEPSWADLGSFWGASWGHAWQFSIEICNVSINVTFLKNEVSRGDFGPILNRLMSPRGSKMGHAEVKKVS